MFLVICLDLINDRDVNGFYDAQLGREWVRVKGGQLVVAGRNKRYETQMHSKYRLKRA